MSDCFGVVFAAVALVVVGVYWPGVDEYVVLGVYPVAEIRNKN